MTKVKECSLCKSKLHEIYILYESGYQRIEETLFCDNHGIVRFDEE